jgi:hypothetical protein
MEQLKKILAPTLSMLKELNVKVGKNEVDGDYLIKLATNMKLSAIGLEKYVKEAKLSVKGGVVNHHKEEDDE